MVCSLRLKAGIMVCFGRQKDVCVDVEVVERKGREDGVG